MSTILIDWALVEWDGAKKLIGINKENDLFVRTSPIIKKIDETTYVTQTGTTYILEGPPSR